MLSAVILYVLSYPSMLLAKQKVHHRYTHPSPLVLGKATLSVSTLVVDSNQPVSRRFEPSSRNFLIGEQTNPWELLHPQDKLSRHRGAKPPRRYELSEEISLLSLAYLLSVELWL